MNEIPEQKTLVVFLFLWIVFHHHCQSKSSFWKIHSKLINLDANTNYPKLTNQPTKNNNFSRRKEMISLSLFLQQQQKTTTYESHGPFDWIMIKQK